MASSRTLGSRPRSPPEEDLQALYDQVWDAFASESPTDGDLETIVSGYADDNDNTPSSAVVNPPPQQVPQIAGPGHSPYPTVDTQNTNIEAPKSPTRRRLPPTPGGSSSSVASPLISFSMPEPEPYHPPGTARPTLYNSTSYASFASSSNGPSDLVRRTTTSSGTSNDSGLQFPHAPEYSGGSRSSNDGGGERTPVSSNDYRSHASTTSYSSSTSYGSYTNNTSVAGDGIYRPPGALPPSAPSGYQDKPSDSAHSHQAPAFDAYDTGKKNGTNGYYQQSQHSHLAQVGQYDSYSFKAPPPPPPPPPKTQPPPPAPSSNPYLDSSPQYANQAIVLSPISASLYEGFPDFSLKNPTGSPSKSSFFDKDHQISTRLAQEYPEAGPSSTSRVTPQDSQEEEDGWDPSAYNYGDEEGTYDDIEGGPSHVARRPTDILRSLADYSPRARLELHDEPQDEFWEDEDEDDESRFVNFSLLSHIAVQLRDKIPRGTHVKGSIPYPRAFTGKDIVSTIQLQIQRELAINHGVSTSDRRVALQVARSLQSQLFFYEVEWGGRVLQDGVEDVYMFLDDQENGSDAIPEREELPTGVITMLTRCYSPSCGDGIPCYAYACPRKGNHTIGLPAHQLESPTVPKEQEWAETIDAGVLSSLPQSEITRQGIIHKLITKEESYLQDLDLVESVFIKPLRAANPPVMSLHLLDDFIDDVFGNILDLRECNRRLLEVMYVRQREEGPVILRIGDIFLDAATEFRFAYPTYIGHYPIAEVRLKDETDTNPELRLFLEQCSRQQSSRATESPRLDLKHFLNRPAEHLQKYPVLLEAVYHETEAENPDAEFLVEAIEAIKNLHSMAQLRTWQSAMGKGTASKYEWHDIVPTEIREQFDKKEMKRQSIIFELIKGEMAYVKDLENIMNIYIVPLRSADPPIIAPDRLDQFCEDVFHNYDELFSHHKKLVDKLHEIQREQHPHVRSITAAMFDAALNFREAYMEYIPNYPIAAYRIDDEMANNLAFKTFVEHCIRHADAHRLDMKNFINRPIPRLLRYELLLRGIMEETPLGHEDIETIPNVIDVIKALGKETEPGVFSAKQKVEVWRYNANLVFKQGEAIDMDLLDQNRSLVHSGKLLRQPDSGLEWNGWSELHVLLFDNYLVMTKPKDKDGVIKYQVNRRPIPLDLLTPVNFTDPPTQRSAGLLRKLGGGTHGEGGNATPGLSPESATDSRSVYPLTLHHNGRMGGPYILYAESAQIRNEWKQKLEEALGLRKIVQESNKVFEIEYLSRDTFIMPSMAVAGGASPAWNQDNQYTGKVTCSVPFNTPDGRALVAIGCTEGVWIGFRHDPKSIRRVLHLKMVTQCAMLEDFGIFLVLADKALFAYHIEALVPSSPHGAHTSQVPQKLSGTKDVHFFSVGTLQNRTLIVYMKKKGLDSIFRVLEPVGDKINERVKAPIGFGSRLGFRSAKSEWFRVYRDFFLPSDSFDVIFLKARIAIFCAKGFEIMNLHDFDSITIPQREDPRHAQLAKRCESCRPLGMFRSTDEEFLLCYDEFGLYVDKHGDPCRSAGTIEWEGTAERVAFHSPYILLFDSRFIEIRHIQTGRLAQIISGTDVRCLWDGRGVSTSVTTPATENGEENQEAQVHVVMNSTEGSSVTPGGLRTRNIVQHVCELIPTVSLFPPAGGPPSAATTNASATGGAHTAAQAYANAYQAPAASTYATPANAYGAPPAGAYAPSVFSSYSPSPHNSYTSSVNNAYTPTNNSYAPSGHAYTPSINTPYPPPTNHTNHNPNLSVDGSGGSMASGSTGGGYFGRGGSYTPVATPSRSPESHPAQWRT
ncbi:CNH domain-containing protein [Crassisporium funariophilum]|nr:CNH domain-containing protein [Crassisporium funariophilum]